MLTAGRHALRRAGWGAKVSRSSRVIAVVQRARAAPIWAILQRARAAPIWAVVALACAGSTLAASPARAEETVRITEARFSPNVLGAPTDAFGSATIGSTDLPVPSPITHVRRVRASRADAGPGRQRDVRAGTARTAGPPGLPGKLQGGHRRRRGGLRNRGRTHQRAVHARILPGRQPAGARLAADLPQGLAARYRSKSCSAARSSPGRHPTDSASASTCR